ncbi:hypothetical protein [Vulcanisaeta distributa]|uniref:hypothetical protein n=1 Tax=Vulcanisaeta distributa TaxID=164451 RepID=UPI0006D1D084|nr:hypothetical protein [Vulcanisaeta distributa]
MSNEINIEDLIRNFRVGFDKAGLTIYVIPKKDAESLMAGKSYYFNNEDVQLYGTKVILHLPCNGGAIHGRYLVRGDDYVKGLYLVITNMECDVDISWNEEGLNTRMHVRSDEALIVIVRLMMFKYHKAKPNSHALRIMRTLNLSGKFLYSDANREIQVFGIQKIPTLQTQSTCVTEFSIKQWKLVFGKCGFVTEVFNDGNTTALLIIDVNSMVISRYFPSLNKWYELNRVSGFNNYLVVLDGEV